jgi:hypothetical protein
MIGERLKTANKKALKAWRHYHPEEEPNYGERWIYPPIGIYRKTQSFWSGPLWGNPRRRKGVKELTMQEKIAAINEKEMMAAIAQW